MQYMHLFANKGYLYLQTDAYTACFRTDIFQIIKQV